MFGENSVLVSLNEKIHLAASLDVLETQFVESVILDQYNNVVSVTWSPTFNEN